MLLNTKTIITSNFKYLKKMENVLRNFDLNFMCYTYRQNNSCRYIPNIGIPSSSDAGVILSNYWDFI